MNSLMLVLLMAWGRVILATLGEGLIDNVIFGSVVRKLNMGRGHQPLRCRARRGARRYRDCRGRLDWGSYGRLSILRYPILYKSSQKSHRD